MGHNKRRPKNPKNSVETETPEMETIETNFENSADDINAVEAASERPSEKRNGRASEESLNTESQNDTAARRANGNGHDTEDADEKNKIHLEFYGSELIRQKAPKVMEIADTVAEEWVQDGQFEGLPLGSPLAQLAAAKALRTAKDVEKKLEEKGVFAMAKMGMDYVKTKLDNNKRGSNQDVSRK